MRSLRKQRCFYSFQGRLLDHSLFPLVSPSKRKTFKSHLGVALYLTQLSDAFFSPPVLFVVFQANLTKIIHRYNYKRNYFFTKKMETLFKTGLLVCIFMVFHLGEYIVFESCKLLQILKLNVSILLAFENYQAMLLNAMFVQLKMVIQKNVYAQLKHVNQEKIIV